MSPDNESDTGGTTSIGGRPTKRAICLAGGGPAVGLHIGALESLKDREIDFGNEHSIWALSCIGAWVGVVYNQAKKDREIEETYDFFQDVFRDDQSFQSFPTNTLFAPDWTGVAEAMLNYLFEPRNYRNAFLPRHIMKSWVHTLSFLGSRKNWRNFSEGDFNRWTLNHVLAVNPAVRFLTGLLYKSEIDGRTRLHYENSKILKDIKFEKLNKSGKPFLFHNAFNFARKDIDIFANDPPEWKGKRHKAISAASLCACSALPFIEQTVRVGGPVYCEGALVDTVNFKSLLEEHHKPNEFSTRSGSTGSSIRTRFTSPRTCMMRWQISANCSRRRLAKTISSCSSFTCEKTIDYPPTNATDRRGRVRSSKSRSTIRSITTGLTKIWRPDESMALKRQPMRTNCIRCITTRRRRRR